MRTKIFALSVFLFIGCTENESKITGHWASMDTTLVLEFFGQNCLVTDVLGNAPSFAATYEHLDGDRFSLRASPNDSALLFERKRSTQSISINSLVENGLASEYKKVPENIESVIVGDWGGDFSEGEALEDGGLLLSFSKKGVAELKELEFDEVAKKIRLIQLAKVNYKIDESGLVTFFGNDLEEDTRALYVFDGVNRFRVKDKEGIQTLVRIENIAAAVPKGYEYGI